MEVKILVENISTDICQQVAKALTFLNLFPEKFDRWRHSRDSKRPPIDGAEIKLSNQNIYLPRNSEF